MVEIAPAYGPGQPTTTRSSPAFATEYTPSASRPATVCASVDFEVALGKSIEIVFQIKFGETWVTVDRRKLQTAGGVAEVLGVTPALTLLITDGVLLFANVPAGLPYRVTKSGTGSATITAITETLM